MIGSPRPSLCPHCAGPEHVGRGTRPRVPKRYRALISATGLDRLVFAGQDNKRVKGRLKEIGEGDWAAAAVKKAIDEIQAAIITAAVAGEAGASAAGTS